MARVVVVGEDSARIAARLGELGLAGLDIEVHAPGSAPKAEILLGSPKALATILDEASGVAWVQSTWAGVTPLVEHPRRDYCLTGIKGVFGQAMSEYVLGWLLALERGIIRRATERRWDPRLDPNLAGKRLGIMGTGSIGGDVARACSALGLAVSGLNSDGRAVPGFDACYPTGECLAFAEGLDYLVALLPDTPATSGLVDADLLARLSPGAILVNAGRANSVLDEDLLAALTKGQLKAAVLDVTREEPLPEGHRFWSVPGLYLTSHTAAPSSVETVVGVFADNYQRYRRGEPLRHVVNFDRGY